jgi:hypothetical protein
MAFGTPRVQELPVQRIWLRLSSGPMAAEPVPWDVACL